MLGSVIYPEQKKKNWIKIDGVLLGESSKFFTQQSYSSDIGKLLDDSLTKTDIVTVAFNWKTGNVITRNGFDMSDPADSKSDPDYTTFIIKTRQFPINLEEHTDSSCLKYIGSRTNQYDDTVARINASTTYPLRSKSFVAWNGTDFTLNNKNFYPCGPNIYWLGLTETHSYPPPEQVEEMFTVAFMMNATVIRSHTLGFSSGTCHSLYPALLTINESAFGSIDFSFFLAAKHGIKLICSLTDSYAYSHGNYGDFCRFRGVEKRAFWTNRLVIHDFKAYIRAWLEHVNIFTGIAIKDDSTLFMIELGNELGNIRSEHDSTSVPTREWLEEISEFVKSITDKHFVLDPSDECLGRDNFDIKTLGAYSAHFYQEDVHRLNYLADLAAKVNKPMIVGEFSSKFGKNWFKAIENNKQIKGSFFWSLYPHHTNGKKIEHNDGFTLWYPENEKQILAIGNHFRRLQNLQIIKKSIKYF